MKYGDNQYRFLLALAMIPKGWTIEELVRHYNFSRRKVELFLSRLGKLDCVMSKGTVKGKTKPKNKYYCMLQGVDMLNNLYERTKKNKSLTAFIEEHREELTKAILLAGAKGSINDNDRRGWILNDEGLYRWARSEGVRI
jgi:hypothetical protein